MFILKSLLCFILIVVLVIKRRGTKIILVLNIGINRLWWNLIHPHSSSLLQIMGQTRASLISKDHFIFKPNPSLVFLTAFSCGSNQGKRWSLTSLLISRDHFIFANWNNNYLGWNTIPNILWSYWWDMAKDEG